MIVMAAEGGCNLFPFAAISDRCSATIFQGCVPEKGSYAVMQPSCDTFRRLFQYWHKLRGKITTSKGRYPRLLLISAPQGVNGRPEPAMTMKALRRAVSTYLRFAVAGGLVDKRVGFTRLRPTC